MSWQLTTGEEYHQVALSGRPVLLYGTPRYGFASERAAIAHFETGRGWLEDGRPFNPTHWMPLPEPPVGFDRG